MRFRLFSIVAVCIVYMFLGGPVVADSPGFETSNPEILSQPDLDRVGSLYHFPWEVYIGEMVKIIGEGFQANSEIWWSHGATPYQTGFVSVDDEGNFELFVEAAWSRIIDHVVFYREEQHGPEDYDDFLNSVSFPTKRRYSLDNVGGGSVIAGQVHSWDFVTLDDSISGRDFSSKIIKLYEYYTQKVVFEEEWLCVPAQATRIDLVVPEVETLRGLTPSCYLLVLQDGVLLASDRFSVFNMGDPYVIEVDEPIIAGKHSHVRISPVDRVPNGRFGMNFDDNGSAAWLIPDENGVWEGDIRIPRYSGTTVLRLFGQETGAQPGDYCRVFLGEQVLFAKNQMDTHVERVGESLTISGLDCPENVFSIRVQLRKFWPRNEDVDITLPVTDGVFSLTINNFFEWEEDVEIYASFWGIDQEGNYLGCLGGVKGWVYWDPPNKQPYRISLPLLVN